MRSNTSRTLGLVALSLLAWSIAATVALAFDSPLSSEAIRDAYFLATGNPQKRTAFFDEYTHYPAVPESGPSISSIQIETPFASTVEDIAMNSLNYREPDVQQDFFGKPADFRVQVQIAFTATYPPSTTTSMQLGNFWDDFTIHLMQSGNEIGSRSVKGIPLYSDRTISGYIGATLVADYDARRIDSGPVTVVVTGPDDARVESEFDLANLR
jgi:hypothetical protein